MSYTYAAYYHHQFDHHQPQFDHPHMQPLPHIAQLETRWDNTDRRINDWRPPPAPEPAPPYSGSATVYHNSQLEYQPPFVLNQYALDVHNTSHSGECQQPLYLNPNIDGQPPYPFYQPNEYEQRVDDKFRVRQQPPYTSFDSRHFGEISTPPGQRALHEYSSYAQPPPRPSNCWDPPAQRALYGCPPNNQSYHVPQPQLDPIPAYGAPSHRLATWDYRVQQEHRAYDQQQWQDCYNQTQTEIPAAYTPSWRPESTPSIFAPVQSVVATKFESEEGIYSYVYGSKHRMREQECAISDSLILDARVEYSCDDPKDFDCVSNHGMVEEEHCDNLESVLSIDSSLETELDALDHDGSGVSRPSSIALICDNHGVEEDRDASLGNRQVPSFEEIYPLCGSDAFLPVIERDFKVLLQGNVHDRLDILQLRKMMNSSLLKEDKDGFYVDLHNSNVAMNYRSALLDADARLIPPRMDTRCLSIRGRVDKIPVLALNYHEATLVIFYGDNEGRRSAVRCAFDPGGDKSRQAYVVSYSLLCFFVFPP